jgi:hypothetical protein
MKAAFSGGTVGSYAMNKNARHENDTRRARVPPKEERENAPMLTR